MTKPAKPATSKPAVPAKKPAKKPAQQAAAMPAVTEMIKKSAKPSAVAQLTKVVAETKPVKAPVSAPSRAKPVVGPEQRRCYIEVAAYFIAERHGFTPGREREDWLEAEAEIDRMLG